MREKVQPRRNRSEAWSWGRLVYVITLILLLFSILSLNRPNIYLLSAIYPLIPRLLHKSIWATE